jgi:hypothetical protein
MADTGGSFGGKRKFEPGGTPGGGGEFLAGVAMMALGVYLVFSRVTVHTSFWRYMGSPGTSFGVTLLPLLVGVGMLTFNGRSILGWLLAVAGIALILVGVLMNLDIYFQPTSLWMTLVMFGLIASGLGLFAKALRPHHPHSPPAPDA